MLRPVVIGIVAVLLVTTLACACLAAAGIVSMPAGLALWGALQLLVVLAGFLFERTRYKPLDTTPPPGFVATGERFVDPATGVPVQVWFDAARGERRYVVEPRA